MLALITKESSSSNPETTFGEQPLLVELKKLSKIN